MQFKLILVRILPVLVILCQSSFRTDTPAREKSEPLVPQNNTFRGVVEDIQLPPGYKRLEQGKKSFGNWLRAVPLRADNTVYLYNGRPKAYQGAQFAVLDIPVGNKDLQQCADAVMRLRAQYLRDNGLAGQISFIDNAGTRYRCPDGPGDKEFERYLERVFSYCGTLSLEKQLRKVAGFNEIEPGDVLIKGGTPGHAVIVMDVALNSANHKIYLLAQSYMPAQSIHILKNPMDAGSSPWYAVPAAPSSINTPEWTFDRNQLRRW